MNRSRRGKGHLPISVTVIIDLILMSSVCLTALTVSLLPRLSEEDFNKLPVYCKPNTGYFECLNATSGVTFCLPNSLKCRIACGNNAQLSCPGFAATTPSCPLPGQFQCPATSPVQCVADHLVCDKVTHCPDGADEAVEMCRTRGCSPGQFACQSPGHCIPGGMRCDGSFDCERTGLADYSDELNCPMADDSVRSECQTGEFRCPVDPVTHRGGSCLPMAYACDRFKDCPDGSDELNCPDEACNHEAGELACDGRCLKASVRCDGVRDCDNGVDEFGCGASSGLCQFQSEFFCGLSPASAASRCVSAIFVCDGVPECMRGEDEVCAIDNALCASEAYWTCKSGRHCVRAESRCDGLPHCPDGSDERGCRYNASTTAVPRHTTPVHFPAATHAACRSPQAGHLCNGTRDTCVSPAAACADQSPVTCPGPDTQLSGICDRIRNLTAGMPPVCGRSRCPVGQLCRPALTSDGLGLVAECACPPGYRMSGDRGCEDVDECSEELGACDQLCSNAPLGNFTCSCLPGYRMEPDPPGRGVCRAVGAVKLLVATETGIHAIDSDTGAVVKISAGSQLNLPKFLAFDADRKLVFFHTRDGRVGHLGLGGGPVTVLANDSVLDSLAYDWTRQLLFYTVPEAAGGTSGGGLWAMDAVTGARSELLRLSCPRGLALQPGDGRLLVSLWCGPRPGVYSVRMDGGDLRPLVTGLGAPGHLTLDGPRLYWLDAQLRGVYSCRVGVDACTDLRAVWHMGPGFDGLPLGLDVFEDKLLWSDLRAKGVYSIDKFSGAPLKLVAQGPGGEAPLSAVAYHSVRQAEGARTRACRCAGAGGASVCVSLSGGAKTCLPGAGVPRGNASLSPQAVQMEAAAADDGSGGSSGHGAAVPAAVASALLVCLLCGSFVAVACLRSRSRRAGGGLLGAFLGALRLRAKAGGANGANGANGASGGDAERPAMPKINSRTPLTECEIGLENQSAC